MATETWYVGFCPDADICKRYGRRLCCCRTEEEAREKIVAHLMNSSYHAWGSDRAVEAADVATLEQQEYPVEDAEVHADAGGKGDGGKGGGRHSGKGGGDRGGDRHQPYGKGGGGNGKGSKMSSAALSQVAAVVEATVTRHFQTIVPVADESQFRRGSVMQAIAKCEAAARTAARMARSAATAFEEEAIVMARSLRTLQDNEFNG